MGFVSAKTAMQYHSVTAKLSNGRNVKVVLDKHAITDFPNSGGRATFKIRVVDVIGRKQHYLRRLIKENKQVCLSLEVTYCKTAMGGVTRSIQLKVDSDALACSKTVKKFCKLCVPSAITGYKVRSYSFLNFEKYPA